MFVARMTIRQYIRGSHARAQDIRWCMHFSLHTGRLFSILIAVATGAVASCARAPDAGQESAAESVMGAAQSAARDPLPDCLYVSDDVPDQTDEIELFDPFAPLTSAYFGSFIKAGEVVPDSVRGLVFDRRNGANPELFVVDQNATSGAGPAGEIFRYRKPNGKLHDVFIPSSDPNAPFAPRGAIIHDGILYVADVGDNEPDFNPGRISMYDAQRGDFLGDLDGVAFPSNPNTTPRQVIGPRGLVIGPDGLLYASVFSYTDRTDGQIVRFNPATGAFLGIFVDSDTCGCDLNRPEGLVFGPDGNLYVTSFSDLADPPSVDKILIFDAMGHAVDSIDLWKAGEARAFAQALLFGPEGDLYVPITGGDVATAGQLRVYDVATKTFTLLAQAGGPLQQPQYLTFCGTNPATLAYEPQRHCACGQ
jgi:hypothetical protein